MPANSLQSMKKKEGPMFSKLYILQEAEHEMCFNDCHLNLSPFSFYQVKYNYNQYFWMEVNNLL